MSGVKSRAAEASLSLPRSESSREKHILGTRDPGETLGLLQGGELGGGLWALIARPLCVLSRLSNSK